MREAQSSETSRSSQACLLANYNPLAILHGRSSHCCAHSCKQCTGRQFCKSNLARSLEEDISNPNNSSILGYGPHLWSLTALRCLTPVSILSQMSFSAHRWVSGCQLYECFVEVQTQIIDFVHETRERLRWQSEAADSSCSKTEQ